VTLEKLKRFKSQKNLKLTRSLPCPVGMNCQGQVTAHHIRSKGAGGGDELWNLMPLCMWHHRLIHDVGKLAFQKKHNLAILSEWSTKSLLAQVEKHPLSAE